MKDLQETYETLRFKITSFYSFFYMEGIHTNKEFVVARSLQKALRLYPQAPLFLSVISFSIYV